MGRVKGDHIKRLITLTSYNVKRLGFPCTIKIYNTSLLDLEIYMHNNRMWQHASNWSRCINQISQVRKCFETLSCTTFHYKMEKKIQWNFIRANVDLFLSVKLPQGLFCSWLGYFLSNLLPFLLPCHVVSFLRYKKASFFKLENWTSFFDTYLNETLKWRSLLAGGRYCKVLVSTGLFNCSSYSVRIHRSVNIFIY